MKILICALNGYPSPNDIYSSGFIHQRVLGYQKAGHECVVFSVKHENNGYEYDGVKVYQRTMAGLADIYKLVKPDILFTHFVNRHYVNWLEENSITIPQVIWIHGFEALSWKRRLFSFSFSKEFIKFILANTKKRWIWRKSWKNRKDVWKNASFIFVSQWMKKIAEADLGFRFSRSSIIPNPINHEHFKFTEYDESRRLKAVMIRSFDSRKYATDIAIDAIKILSRSPVFDQFQFSIYGKGKLFDKQTEKIKGFPNVSLHNHFVDQKNIPEIHQQHGILLCPTRQDAQGVTMCEGMSSGLITIASNNTAIPEYMPDGCGYRGNTPGEVAEILEHIASHPEEALLFAKQGSDFILNKCHYDRIIEKELEVAKGLSD
ncbi:MAG: hypothetical protein B6241_01145 [Spirochaetaceae bacterium 4572_59]|nr:MAG: hypothetical protein B6241_01145 [Spirochaetaceae bacterium 4572_59]